jgi:hypothetical protein
VEADIELTPDARAKPGISGTPVEIGDETWLLADYIPRLEPVWDRLVDRNALTRSYDHEDTNSAAVRLIFTNYNLSPDEAARLILSAPRPDLVHAVEIAIFGDGESYRGYSDWAKVSLWANAIDPDVLPPAMLRPVLDHLITIGRAVPAADYLSSAQAASVRNSFLNLVK